MDVNKYTCTEFHNYFEIEDIYDNMSIFKFKLNNKIIFVIQFCSNIIEIQL